LIETRTKKLII